MYYGGCIGIIEVIFNYYGELTDTLQWVALRRPYLTMELFMITELIVRNDSSLVSQAESHLLSSFDYESKMQSLKVSGSTIFHKFKDLSLRLDSSAFCDVIKPELSSAQAATCADFNNSSLERGMEANIQQLFKDITMALNKYQEIRNTDYDIQEIFDGSTWDATSI